MRLAGKLVLVRFWLSGCPWRFVSEPEGSVPAYCQDSDLRKPGPGMILEQLGIANVAPPLGSGRFMAPLIDRPNEIKISPNSCR